MVGISADFTSWLRLHIFTGTLCYLLFFALCTFYNSSHHCVHPLDHLGRWFPIRFLFDFVRCQYCLQQQHTALLRKLLVLLLLCVQRRQNNLKHLKPTDEVKLFTTSWLSWYLGWKCLYSMNRSDSFESLSFIRRALNSQNTISLVERKRNIRVGYHLPKNYWILHIVHMLVGINIVGYCDLKPSKCKLLSSVAIILGLSHTRTSFIYSSIFTKAIHRRFSSSAKGKEMLLYYNLHIHSINTELLMHSFRRNGKSNLPAIWCSMTKITCA